MGKVHVTSHGVAYYKTGYVFCSPYSSSTGGLGWFADNIYPVIILFNLETYLWYDIVVVQSATLHFT